MRFNDSRRRAWVKDLVTLNVHIYMHTYKKGDESVSFSSDFNLDLLKSTERKDRIPSQLSARSGPRWNTIIPFTSILRLWLFLWVFRFLKNPPAPAEIKAREVLMGAAKLRRTFHIYLAIYNSLDATANPLAWLYERHNAKAFYHQHEVDIRLTVTKSWDKYLRVKSTAIISVIYECIYYIRRYYCVS